MATAFLFGDLDNELLVIGNCEFLQSKHRSLGLLATHNGYIVLGAERFKHLLLHGGSLDNLLIHNLERYKVNVEWDIAGILDFGVEIQQAIVGIDGFQEELHPETL